MKFKMSSVDPKWPDLYIPRKSILIKRANWRTFPDFQTNKSGHMKILAITNLGHQQGVSCLCHPFIWVFGNFWIVHILRNILY